jgi:hypothetical protein
VFSDPELAGILDALNAHAVSLRRRARETRQNSAPGSDSGTRLGNHLDPFADNAETLANKVRAIIRERANRPENWKIVKNSGGGT